MPIYLATLDTYSLRMTGDIADGWLGTSFTPDVPEAHLAHLRAGAEKAGRTLDDLTLCVDAGVAVTDDPEAFFPALKMQLAFQLSAMGSPTMNFYSDAYARAGFERACEEVRDLWLDRKREEAVAAVLDDMVMATNVLGDAAAVERRLARYAEVGIDLLMVHPLGRDEASRLGVLGQATELANRCCSSREVRTVAASTDRRPR